MKSVKVELEVKEIGTSIEFDCGVKKYHLEPVTNRVGSGYIASLEFGVCESEEIAKNIALKMRDTITSTLSSAAMSIKSDDRN